ncbi:MAG: hypothetical protein UV78_C0020G0006 [Parcubacteria group bacterium GW2011_GWA2_43_17]|nr:MAG: hypothetical protein UV78_C0020G0006 [Parcubacteria group bacterium GW2011_GWA2_43_17]OHB43068.1 MAG: hypothetical protein A2Y13_00500 [Planctomycetes bacterium GWC2_45_44]
MRKEMFLVMVALAVFAGTVFAGPSWTGATGDGLWTTNLNWDSGVAPGTGSTPIVRSAYYTNGFHPTFAAGMTGFYGQVIVGYPDAAGLFEARLDVTGGSMITNSLWISFGWDTSYKGVINMSGGSINATSEIRVGYYGAAGRLNMSNGTITGGNMFLGSDGGKGTIQLSGGTIDVPYLGMYGSSLFNISGTGKLIVNDADGTIASDLLLGYYAGSDMLTGNGLADDAQLNIVWDGVGHTTVTAIPEPATLSLLSLGIAALIRRKK